MGISIIRLINSFLEDDRILERQKISVSPVDELSQMAYMIDYYVIQSASKEEKAKIKDLFVGRLFIHQYTTPDEKYSIRIVKHFRPFSLVPHKVYLIDNTKETYRIAYKYSKFFYYPLRKAVYGYLYKPGEKIVLPLHKRLWFKLVIFLCVIAFILHSCNPMGMYETFINETKQQYSTANYNTSSFSSSHYEDESDSQADTVSYSGSGYTITLSNDWEEEYLDGYDLALVYYGDYYDLDSLGAIAVDKVDNEGYTGDEYFEMYLNSLKNSGTSTIISTSDSEVTNSGGYNYSSWSIECTDRDENELLYIFEWITPVGSNVYHFIYFSDDKNVFEELKDEAKKSFASVEFD